MAKFQISFTLNGSGAASEPVDLPVTALDNTNVQINGLEPKLFRVLIQNILDRPVTLNAVATPTGEFASRVNFELHPGQLTIQAGQSAVISIVIAPVQPLIDGMSIPVNLVGTEVV